MVKSIGVIGGGIVGRATARCFVEFSEVRVNDKVATLSTHSQNDVLHNSDLIFVCLPTPQKKDSLECDVNCLVEFFESLPDWARDKNFVLRSTVPIGFTRTTATGCGLVNLVHSPEFLTARCAITDAQLPARNIVGIPKVRLDLQRMSEPGEATISCDFHESLYENDASLLLNKLYYERFPGVPTYCMTSDESEAVKLVTNSFFAVKVAYFNEIHQLCTKLGLDFEKVRAGVLSDGRIAHSHTKVPGPDGKFGFGGECLVKDLASLMDCFDRVNLRHDMTEGAYWRNVIDRERK